MNTLSFAKREVRDQEFWFVWPLLSTNETHPYFTTRSKVYFFSLNICWIPEILDLHLSSLTIYHPLSQSYLSSWLVRTKITEAVMDFLCSKRASQASWGFSSRSLPLLTGAWTGNSPILQMESLGHRFNVIYLMAVAGTVNLTWCTGFRLFINRIVWRTQ